MAKPLEWLGKFIEDELEAVVQWRESSKDIYDPESRFEDDGSNLRSTVRTTDWPPESTVQITEIVSCRTPMVVVITDGSTQIKAKLFEKAIQTLESEIDQKIDLETTNDVVAIRDATVASTPYGPKDEHVQLEIHGLEYKYHLRKSLGSTLPILQRSKVSRLVNEITEIRHQQYVLPGSPTEQESARANPVTTATTELSRDGCHIATNEKHRPQSQQSMSQMQSRSQYYDQQSPVTQNPIATQLSSGRKRKAPSFDEDGLEILQGNNLARPYGPNFSVPSTAALPSKRRVSDNRDKLLGLLKSKPQATTTRQPQTTVPGHSVEVDVQTARSSPSTSAPSVTQEHSAEVEVHPGQSSPPTPAMKPGTQGTVEQMSVDIIEDVPKYAAPRVPSQPHVPTFSDIQNYNCKRIEPSQRTLLDKADSWIPPLPGKQFPEPNIPIQLLTDWHDELQVIPAAAELSRAETIGEAHIAEESSHHDSGSGSDVSDTFDEELPWSDSPSRSPLPKRPVLPPDSSIEHDPRSSHSASRTYYHPESPQATLSERAALPPDSSMGNSLHSTPLQKPNNTGSNVSKPSTKNQRRSLQNSDISSPTHASPSIAIRRRRSARSSQTSASHIQSQQPDIDLSSPVQVKAYRTPAKSDQLSRPRTSVSIVKGTQLADDDIEMEESVPRELGRPMQHKVKPIAQQSVRRTVSPSLEQDPGMTHHKNRSDFFRRLQREEWLLANYRYDPSAKVFSIMAILSKYKSRYPKDDLRLAELAEALEKVFPALYPDGSESAVGGLAIIPKAAERSKNAFATKPPRVRDSSMDVEMTGSDLGAVGAATNVRSLSAHPDRHVAVALTKRGDSPAHSIRPSSSATQSIRMAGANSRDRKASYANSGDSTPAAEEKHVRRSPMPVEKEVSEERSAEPTKKDRRRSNFEEFERAMKNVRPGGAFAEARVPLRTRRGDGGEAAGKSARLDVMEWDV